ncbi:C-type Lectin CRL-like [Ptychodera flava]|uniref:C-type Lectin CRL-like n=1 Tax=Ptychodera flava TaxID=63121 RepID=UPI00396A46B0
MSFIIKLNLLLLIQVCSVIFAQYQASTCIGGDKFALMNDKVTWNDASDICLQSSGQLAVLNTEEISNELVAFINDNSLSELNSRGFWIGLHDRHLEDSFEWVDGSAVTFTNWYGNMPDNARKKDQCHGQDCVQLWKKPPTTPLWQWDDDYCFKRKLFFCQYKNTPECV